MVQETNILRCYSCHIFQVHIVKKAKKWQCKICNEKQSIQHVYFTGCGEDCRLQVQHLNFTTNKQEAQDSKEASNKIQVKARELDSPGRTERPVITQSKWAKYMVPQTVSHETGSNDDGDIEDQLFNFNRNILNAVNTFDPDLTTKINDSLDGTLVDQEERNDSLALINNFVQVPTGGTSSSSNCSYNSNEQRKNVIIIREHKKRKSYDENSGPESEFNSISYQPAGKMFKQTNLVDELSLRRQNLRDIVKGNRKNLDKSTTKEPIIVEGESVLEEINYFPNGNVNRIDISNSSAKKRTIFETDYDDLDEILDF